MLSYGIILKTSFSSASKEHLQYHDCPLLKEGFPKMNVDEFLLWREDKEGRWELHDGIPVRLHDPARMHSERARHARAKGQAYLAFKAAIAKQNLPCEAFPNGMTVRINADKSYEPDALVNCGDKIDGDQIIVPNPVIIVEVLSPSTAYQDVGTKLLDYFSLPSMKHYLIANPVTRSIQHFSRNLDGTTDEKTYNAGTIPLNPPDISITVEEVFES